MNAAPRETTPRAQSSTASSAERLLDLQLSFNLYPSQYAHASWLERLGVSRADHGLHDSPLWTRSVSSALLRAANLDKHFDSDFFDPAKRLALLDATTLTRIAGLVGAALLRERIKRAVRQEEVRALRATVGAEAHAFAVRFGGLLPMVTPPFENGPWPAPDEWQKGTVLQMFAALPAHAIGVTGRMRMRFPSDWSPTRQRLNEPQRVSLTRLIVAVIVQSAPEWRWLFEAATSGEA
jgi:hypothetical protein